MCQDVSQSNMGNQEVFFITKQDKFRSDQQVEKARLKIFWIDCLQLSHSIHTSKFPERGCSHDYH